ncbi:pirin family protein [Neptunomonas japonica]|uniref:pirin family protein n=1 Tax=Neptunomonas japonica TaxID=417574 RepID=UPI000413F362|nr:pirin family protein [Neptunomonas japonica]
MSTSTQQRTIARIIPAVDSQDGAGVKLKRSVGKNAASRIDPFLMLDAFSSANPDDYIAGFPPHPHRGFETVTYMLDGHMIHKDHMGNEGDLRTGGVQWMTAGRGVIHEERPQMTEGLMRGFQLWINLPASEKMKPAAYQNIEPQEVPVITLNNGSTLKVIAGEYQLEDKLATGPIAAGSTQVTYLDIHIPKGEHLSLPVSSSLSTFIYLFEGQAGINKQALSKNNAAILGSGNNVTIHAAEMGARMLLIAGKAIGEPIAQYGPFVMNTMKEVDQAIEDYQNNTLTN